MPWEPEMTPERAREILRSDQNLYETQTWAEALRVVVREADRTEARLQFLEGAVMGMISRLDAIQRELESR